MIIGVAGPYTADSEEQRQNRERDLVSSKGLPVYYHMEEVPPS